MSIRLKLTIYWTVLLAILMGIAGVVVVGLFAARQWSALDAALTEEADTSAANIAHLDLAAAASMVRQLSAERDLGVRRRVRLVYEGGALVVDAGVADSDLPILPPAASDGGIIEGTNHHFRFAVFPLKLEGRDAWLEDGVDADAIRTSVSRLETTLILALPLMIAICAAGGYVMAGRALRPLGDITAELTAIEPRDLSRRLDSPNAADEVGQLTAKLNGMLERIEHASMAERRFAADAAHELRTPLAVLRSELDLAVSKPRSDEEYRESITKALEEVVRLSRMADELLTLARLDGEVGVKKNPLDLSGIVSEVSDTMEIVAAEKNLRLTVQLPDPKTATVEGNADYLKRLMLNLIDNAIKFSPPGGNIRVSLERNGNSARISVADEGPGVGEAERERIFERFFRGSRSHGTAGNGLGLSLCREIARLHGGDIALAPHNGKGSEFVVRLPLAPSTPA